MEQDFEINFSAEHPDYTKNKDNWKTMRDVFAGEKKVKSEGVRYLKPTEYMTELMSISNPDGLKTYQSYVDRSHLKDFTNRAVLAYLGLMWQKKPAVSVPPELEHLPVMDLLLKINRNQILVGRSVCLIDMPSESELIGQQNKKDVKPYICVYDAESLTNWHTDNQFNSSAELDFAVFNECGNYLKDDYSWEYRDRYRCLVLEDGAYKVILKDGHEQTTITPTYNGNKIDFIPVTIINSSDSSAEVTDPPLLNLAFESLHAYKLEADYCQILHLSALETLCLLGFDDLTGKFDEHGNSKQGRIPIGPGQTLIGRQGDEAKFVGPESKGISESRMALENAYEHLEKRSGSFQSKNSSVEESGSSLRVKLASTMSLLKFMAITGGYAIEKVLAQYARFIGLSQDKIDSIKVTPNLDFADFQMLGQDILNIQAAIANGAPISMETFHDLLYENNATEVSFDEEMSRIKSERKKYGDIIKSNMEQFNLEKTESEPKKTIEEPKVEEQSKSNSDKPEES
jgi:hypothetical protein